MELREQYQHASIITAGNLKTIAHALNLQEVSALSLPQLDEVIDLLGKIIPAGNLPGMILSGLARVPGRRPPSKNVRRDVNLLFKGIEQTMGHASYLAFFAGPAAVIWGYQHLLRMAGKDPEDAFPDGTWQFYVEYAMREDTARHANETCGFDAMLRQHNLTLSQGDRLTAWTMAAITCLHQYPALLANEWRERVELTLLSDVVADTPEAARIRKLYSEWEHRRPYARGRDAGDEETYPAYRRRHFRAFLEPVLESLPAELRSAWERQVRDAEARALSAYQQQMSLLVSLEPDTYSETRVPLALKDAHICLIWNGRYVLIPVTGDDGVLPPDPLQVRARIATLVAGEGDGPAQELAALATVCRTELPGLHKKFSPEASELIQTLRTAPIVINGDQRPAALPLAELRQAERGIGDHPLTLFDTGESMVFDQSHIAFDGAWGAALAEIMTNEARSWAVYMLLLPPAEPGPMPDILSQQLTPEDRELIAAAPKVSQGVAAETDVIRIGSILMLRRLFKLRSDLLRLTVNDLLVLYRAIHGVTYRPSADLLGELEELRDHPETAAAAQAALNALAPEMQLNPAILIPIDASQREPRDRLYPMSFEVPLQDLDLLSVHQRTVAALTAYKEASADRAALYSIFDTMQRHYLATLAGFGEVLSRAKQVALAGESTSSGALKLLAQVPRPLRRLVEQIPSRFEILNDILKGSEVFSNVGAVVADSSLTRFTTAKDDNDKKTLVWGVITDANGVMRISLRDFRPHVAQLEAIGRRDLAQRICQEYLESYATGLNHYIDDLHRITKSSRETQLEVPPGLT